VKLILFNGSLQENTETYLFWAKCLEWACDLPKWAGFWFANLVYM